MDGYNGRISVQAEGNNSEAFSALKQCTSFDWHGLKGKASLIRAVIGESPEVLRDSDKAMEAIEKLGMPINDKRSVHLSEWKPSDAAMFKQAEGRILSTLDVIENIKPTGPKLS